MQKVHRVILIGGYIKIAVFSDVHGNLQSFRKAIEFIEKLNDLDYIFIAGDIADDPSPENVDDAYENLLIMFKLIERLDRKYFFVLGNWDCFFKEKFVESRKIKIDTPSLFRKILKEVKARNGVLLERNHVYQLDFYVKITTDPKLVNQKTIFLKHAHPLPMSNALLHIEGHWGLYAQLKGNYINLGFLHGGKEELTGIVWTIELERDKIMKIKWHDLGGKMREYICPFHKEEGLYIIPYNWRKCPVCYKKERARFSTSISRLVF